MLPYSAQVYADPTEEEESREEEVRWRITQPPRNQSYQVPADNGVVDTELEEVASTVK